MGNIVRILNITRVFQAAGIESFIMNMYRNVDRNKVQFDFLVMKNDESCYREEIKNLGGKMYSIDVKAKNTFIRILAESVELYKFLKKNRYEIVHIHYTTPLRAPYLLAAKMAGAPVRIYHSHSAEVSGKSKLKLAVYNYFRRKISKWGTQWFACSNVAAEWMFTKEILEKERVNVIYNGIDVKRFSFNEKYRNEIRSYYHLEDDFVLIHTGRFLEQKNHAFVLEVFKEIKQKYSKVKLILLGTGPLLEEIKAMAVSNGIEKDVIFLGVRSDVERFLSAADCFIMPSLYEGLPVAAVEAECSGLPCVFSENITKEVALTPRTFFLNLDTPIEKWVEVILNYKDSQRSDYSQKVREHGYDVLDIASKLQKFYENVVNNGDYRF